MRSNNYLHFLHYSSNLHKQKQQITHWYDAKKLQLSLKLTFIDGEVVSGSLMVLLHAGTKVPKRKS
jgi:hypothetical protein